MRVEHLFATSALLSALISFAAYAAEAPTQMDRGRDLYARNCLICHQMNGQGVPGTYPPLAHSDLLNGDREKSIRTVCEGLSGEIVVNGKKYNGTMPPVVLDDAATAQVLN